MCHRNIAPFKCTNVYINNIITKHCRSQTFPWYFIIISAQYLIFRLDREQTYRKRFISFLSFVDFHINFYIPRRFIFIFVINAIKSNRVISNGKCIINSGSIATNRIHIFIPIIPIRFCQPKQSHDYETKKKKRQK